MGRQNKPSALAWSCVWQSQMSYQCADNRIGHLCSQAAARDVKAVSKTRMSGACGL